LKALQTDLAAILLKAESMESENDAFRSFLNQQPATLLDQKVQAINETIATKIDCTECGNCCKSLLINVTSSEAEKLADQLQLNLLEVKKLYLDESEGGQLLMNKIPCHFLIDKKCSIYAHRFNSCRDFPHLEQAGFNKRLFSLFMHYGTCPIIFNVMENLKIQTGFKQ